MENVLLRTPAATREIVIWDNGVHRRDAEYLASLDDPRIRVIRSETNVGQNGYARAFRETTLAYMVELDDDVVERARRAGTRCCATPSSALPDDRLPRRRPRGRPHDEASHCRHHIRAHEYTLVEENGVRLLRGPAGGGCAMTSRELNERVGGFRENDEARSSGSRTAPTSRTSSARLHARPCWPTCGSTTPAARTTRPIPEGEGGVLEALLGAQARRRDGRQAGARARARSCAASTPASAGSSRPPEAGTYTAA